ncbi:oxidoreductase [Izhakiella australiensis]|uniref:Oxidoreductase n=1 Tax=Izhakiella australiensis TaxID=1926881 RepID=A0A1S8YIZ5_9GAMM|nr:SDR family oxidoreductase [Izhakiella australiensis]OON38683.1 oxidoreductase [Izhakiella australiensis]
MFAEVFHHGLFAGKTVLVSGGSSGIGLEIARGFSRLGATTIASGSSAQKLASRRQDAADRAIEFRLIDVSDGQQVDAALKDLPRLDVLVNAAGIARPEAEYQQETFMQVMEVNLNSVMRLSQQVMPQLLASRGSIVNVASMLSYLADALVPAYCASKSGVTGLTRALAHRYGPQGVRVNAVAPGYHKTDMTQPLWRDPAAAEHISNRTALKRWGRAEDLVGAVLFLSSDAAQYITGAVLPVDGGYVSGM